MDVYAAAVEDTGTDIASEEADKRVAAYIALPALAGQRMKQLVVPDSASVAASVAASAFLAVDAALPVIHNVLGQFWRIPIPRPTYNHVIYASHLKHRNVRCPKPNGAKFRYLALDIGMVRGLSSNSCKLL